MNYQAIGSGGGIKQIEASTVDFGASDKPLKPEDLAANGLQQFPTVIGWRGAGGEPARRQSRRIKITGGILSDIYRGVIPYWDDPHLTALNPGVKLPHEKITVVHRSGRLGHQLPLHHLSQHGGPDLGQDGRRQRLGELAGRHRRQGQRRRRRSGAPDRGRDRLRRIRLRQAESHDLRPDAEQGGPLGPSEAVNFAAAAAGAKWTSAPGFYCCCSTSRAPTPGRSPARTFILVHKKQTNAQAGMTCSPSSIGPTRTATRPLPA
ncbi:MAG: substrate-binding domain-containing protein [Caulobacteraceae bacterium]